SSNRHSVDTRSGSVNRTNALATSGTTVLPFGLRDWLVVSVTWRWPLSLLRRRSGTDTSTFLSNQGAQRYPHLWITLCVSEGLTSAGYPLGPSPRRRREQARPCRDRSVGTPLSASCHRGRPPQDRSAQSVFA